MASVYFPFVEDQQVRVYKKSFVDKFNDTGTIVLWTGRKESLGILRLSHREFAEIMLHQSMDELR